MICDAPEMPCAYTQQLNFSTICQETPAQTKLACQPGSCVHACMPAPSHAVLTTPCSLLTCCAAFTQFNFFAFNSSAHCLIRNLASVKVRGHVGFSHDLLLFICRQRQQAGHPNTCDCLGQAGGRGLPRRCHAGRQAACCPSPPAGPTGQHHLQHPCPSTSLSGHCSASNTQLGGCQRSPQHKVLSWLTPWSKYAMP